MEVTVDRRRGERRQEGDALAESPAPERRQKVARRRQIDPTTCERDYTGDEIEFMHALDEYKRKAGRMFPTCSEILEVVRDLGYRRLTPEELAKLNPAEAAIGGESVEGEQTNAGDPEQQDAVFIGDGTTTATPSLGGAALADEVDDGSEEESEIGDDRFLGISNGISQGFDDDPHPSYEGASFEDLS